MFKNRPLLLIYLLVFIDVTVGSATGPVRPQFVKGLSNPELWLAVGTALFQGVQLISAPLLGSLSDRYGRKPLVILSSAGTLVANVLLLPVRAWAFFTNRISDGLTNGMYGLMRSSVTDLSSKEDLAKNSGYISTLVSLGGVFGPMVSGVALAFTRNPTRQVTLVVWTIIGLSALNVALSWFMAEPSAKQKDTKNEDKPAPPDRAAVWQAVRDNLNVALLWKRLSDKEKTHSGVRFITILMLLITLHQGYLTYFITYLELGPLKLSAQQTAYFFAYFGGMSALTNFLYFKFLVDIDKINRRTMLIIAAFVGAGLHILYANVGDNLWLLCGAVAIDTLTISLGSGLLNGFFANLTGDDDRGELVGLNQALTGVASLLTTLIYGGLSTINLSLPFYWFAASLVALGVLCWRLKE
ncbi:MFS transporter [Fibrella sp. HMF5335]|uniref:MFS transporter n=1 Tax=Fibrella rubiginis TaxID=2817060 RepID=A0A939GJX8_9BACT|nr:MFS transporter [Fibrella rubiginis]MBO0937818.1 MFS transporter [Fibrella rubiginis]